MLHRDSREIVNTGDHLTSMTSETSCSGLDLGRVTRAPNQYCTTCANVPDIFWGVVGVIVCGVVVLGKVGKGVVVSAWCWEGLRILEKCWRTGCLVGPRLGAVAANRVTRRLAQRPGRGRGQTPKTSA